MKILESKFYKPVKYAIYHNDKLAFSEKLRNHWESSDTPYLDLLGEILTWTMLYYNDNLAIREKNLEDMERCTDFVCLRYSKEKNKIIEKEICYFHKKYEIFIVLTPDLSTEYDKELFEKWVFRVKNVFFDNSDLKNEKHLPKFFEKYVEKYISPDSKISLLVRSWDSIEMKEYKIFPKEIDFKTMYNEDFLEVNKHIVKELETKSKWIVLLHGKPWSWKTNYIKWLTWKISSKKFFFVPTTMISSLTEPFFISFLIENKNSVLVLEDCENYISERNSNNSYTDVVVSILNIADWILSDVVECQIICTFNADIENIDKALLRKWRLIAEYRFKELEPKIANKYFKSINVKQKTDKALLLADVTNFWQNDYKETDKDDDKKKKKIWFSVE